MQLALARGFVAPPGRYWASAHAASAAVLQDHTVAASWFAGSKEGAPDTAIWFAKCTPAGWEAPRIIADSLDQADGNSVLWLDLEGTLRLWYVTMQGRGWRSCIVRERRSQDAGDTLGEDRLVRAEWGWMVRNEPLCLEGRLLMPMYDERDWSAFVLVSEDGGQSWSASEPVRAGVGVIQPALASLSDGRLIMLLRSRGGAVYRTVSSDGGLGWSPPEATTLPNPNSAVELIRLSSACLLVVFNPSTTRRSPLRAALSLDDGATWTPGRDLEIDDGEYSYPTAVQTQDGLVHLLYTYRRETIAHVTFDEAWVRAAEAG